MHSLFFLYLMSALYIIAGLNHFRAPAFYLPMMPPWIPYHRSMIFLSGVCELGLGLMLLYEPLKNFACLSIVLMLIVFLPVHIFMIQHQHTKFKNIPRWILIARLPLQILFMAWAISFVEQEKWTVITNIVFKKIENQELRGDLYLPEGDGPHPAVIVVHGGAWVKRSGDMVNVCHKLANQGFAAFNVTYRFAPKSLYPAAVNDIRDSILWLKQHAEQYQIDSQRIGGWGYSAGSNLILLAGLDSDLKAIVAGGTPARLEAWPHSPLVFEFLGRTFDQDPEIWRAASPVYHVQKNSPPVFLYHGEWDSLVEPEQMDFMAQALKQKDVEVETYLAKYMGHIMVYFFSRESVNKGIEFLQRRL